MSNDKTECYFDEIFSSISAFDKDKKTDGFKKKTLNIIVLAYYNGLNDKDKIGTIEIDIAAMFGDRNKDVEFNLID